MSQRTQGTSFYLLKLPGFPLCNMSDVNTLTDFPPPPQVKPFALLATAEVNDRLYYITYTIQLQESKYQ